MPIIEVQVDRFTKVRKKVSNRTLNNLPDKKQRVFYTPEFFEDRKQGSPLVNPDTHRVIEETGEPVTRVIPDERPDMHLRSGSQRKVKMYRCDKRGGYCKVKSESLKLIKRHVVICKEINEKR